MYLRLRELVAPHALWLLYLVLALSTTFYLFYLDEGYFNFDWMDKPGNWIPFFIYASSIFTGQLVLRILLDRISSAALSTILATTVGLPAGFTVIYLLLS